MKRAISHIVLLAFIFSSFSVRTPAQDTQGSYSLPPGHVIPDRPWTSIIPDPDKFDWTTRGGGRPGYRYRGMLPAQQLFYDYIQQQRRNNVPISWAEQATIRWLISSRRWPEAPRPNAFWAAFMRYLRDQPTRNLNVAQSIMMDQLRSRGLVPVDIPPPPNFARVRDYLNSGPFHSRNWFERIFGRLEPWMDNLYAGYGYDLRPSAPSGSSFPAGDPFNGLKINYSISGATLSAPVDSEGFTINRSFKGVLGIGTLTISGTVRVGGYGADVSLSVWAGDKKEEKKFYVENTGSNGNPQNFSLSVPIPAGARTGGFAMRLDGRYSMGGGHRGCYVTGELGPSQAQIETDRAAADAKWRQEVEDTLARLGYENTPEGKEIEEMRKALAGGDAAWKAFVDERLDQMRGDTSPEIVEHRELEDAMTAGGAEWDKYVAAHGTSASTSNRSNLATASSLVKQGHDYYEKNKYNEAADAFTKAIEANPNSAEAYTGRGNAKRSLRDYAAATADFNQAIALDPRDSEAYRGRSMVKRAQNDFSGALTDSNRAVELAPNFDRAYLTRGLAREGLKDLAGALSDYNRAISLDPSYAMSYFYRARVRFDSKDYAGALADYNRYIGMNANDSAAFNNRGLAKERLGDTTGALADYEKAISLNPNNDTAKRNLSRVRASATNVAPSTSSFYPLDLSVVGGKKGRPRIAKAIEVDDGSWIRFKSTDEKRLTLTIPLATPIQASGVAIISNLDDATYLVQGATIARLTVIKNNGEERFDIQAGVHASEWNYSVGPKHRRVEEGAIGTDRFLATFRLAQPGVVTAIRFDYVETNAPKWVGHAPGFCLRGVTLLGAGVAVSETKKPEVAPTKPSGVSETDLFNSMNIYGVSNGPTAAATFTINRPHVITSIMTYHWNDGRGTRTGTIALRDESGRTYGPWSVTGTPGQGGVPNASWTCTPNISVPAGTYTVVDSEPATWSQNSVSGGRGMAIVKGYPTDAKPQPKPSARPTPTPQPTPTPKPTPQPSLG